MKLLAMLSYIFRYLKTRRRVKLYRQWVERADLPSEAVPEEELAIDIMPKIDKRQLRLPMLYMLLGASVVILLIGLILLIASS